MKKKKYVKYKNKYKNKKNYVQIFCESIVSIKHQSS